MKISSNNQQFQQLNKEKDILERIRGYDIHHQSDQFIVGWLYPSQFLTHNNNNNNNSNNSNESIYILNEEGDFISCPHSPFSPLNGLVFECGEMNLNQYLRNNSTLQIIEKIHILEDIIKSVSFLHKLNIVHFDLKPDNIVLFGKKWKLIDFDSSFDLNVNPKPKITYPVDNVRLTEEFVSPEIMKVIKNLIPEIEINVNMDIWSIGMIGIILFSTHSLWELLYPRLNNFNSSMVSNITQEEIENILRRDFGNKLKSIIGDCLQVNPENRRTNCLELLNKSLFTMKTSTISSSNSISNDKLSQNISRLERLIEQYHIEGQEFISSDLENTLSEILTIISNDTDSFQEKVIIQFLLFCDNLLVIV